jgi:HK97 family phage prohead protease
MIPETRRESKNYKNPLPPKVAPLLHRAGVIEGYASLFGVTDAGGDRVIEGAFARSIRRRGARGVKMLWQHQPDEPIGTWLSLVENSRGLKVTGQLDLSVRRAREALSLIRSGAVDGLSIGFRTVVSEIADAGRVRRLVEIDLWEISVVTFPMLRQARITTVKQACPNPQRPYSISMDSITFHIASLHMNQRYPLTLLRNHMRN